MHSRWVVPACGVALLLAAAGCSTPAKHAPQDELAHVQMTGVLRFAVDPAYPPQSFLTKSGQWKGYDVDVAIAIAHLLGVKPGWATPQFSAIPVGHWGGRWDLAIDVTPTP